MNSHFVGSFSIADFLGTHFPLKALNIFPRAAKAPIADFSAMPEKHTEKAMYKLLAEAIEACGCSPSFKLHNTSDRPDSTSKLKPDCALLLKSDGYADNFGPDYMHDAHILWEVKSDERHDGFITKGGNRSDQKPAPLENLTVEGTKNRGQQIDYATWTMKMQHRTHCYSVSIIGHNARIIRWDRSGAAVSEAFNYVDGSNNYLGEFLWRYEHATAEERGFDSSAVRATSAEFDALKSAINSKIEEYSNKEQRAKLKMSIDASYPAYKLTVFRNVTQEQSDKLTVFGNETEYIVCRPFFDTNSPCGRATRAYYAWGLEEKELIFLKDSWRPDADDSLSEADVYELLENMSVKHLPVVFIAGDVLTSDGEEQVTVTQDSLDKTDAVRPIAWLRLYYHHRIVQKLAYPLYMMQSSKELVQAIRDIIETILEAHKAGGLLHRDISVGNVMLDEDHQAILNDWDHVVQLSSTGPAHVFRTGTWQFISVGLLRDPAKCHSLLDDIESCFWILLFMSVHYFRHNCLEFNIGMFDQREFRAHTNGSFYWFGGKDKHEFLASDDLESLEFDCPPLDTVIRKFGRLLSDFYLTAAKLRRSELDRKMHEKAQAKLRKGKAVLRIFDKALAAKDWPKDDVLPDQFPPQTEREIEKQGVRNHQTTNEFVSGTGQTMEEQVQMRRQIESDPVQKQAYPLYMLQSSKELVEVIRDIVETATILKAHKAGGLLHRDISVGNVMLDEDHQAILNDWDHVFRTGTRQFISVRLLRDPAQRHSLLDDIESCFWILLFMSVHYFGHNRLEFNIGMFDQREFRAHTNGSFYWFGGREKHEFLTTNDSASLKFECPRLETVISKFGRLLSDFYIADKMAERSEWWRKKHEKVQAKLQKGKAVLYIFDKAIAAKDWPKYDVIPDQFPPQTELEIEQQEVRNHQITNKFVIGTGHTMEEQVQMRSQVKSETQGLVPNSNAVPASSLSSRPQALRRAALLSSGSLEIPQQPPHLTHDRPLSFPTAVAQGGVSSIDYPGTGSKRGRPQEADDADVGEGTLDGRVKRSRIMQKREPVQKIHRKRLHTRNGEREKKRKTEMQETKEKMKEARKPAERSRRVRRSMTRSRRK